jgi:asparagine synthase (glutamine-hydrolysing)
LLEARVPFLDHRVVETAWDIALINKVNQNGGKVILQDSLSRHVPRGLWDTHKMSFSVPIAAWLNGPLRELKLYYLSERRLKQANVLDSVRVAEIVEGHEKVSADWSRVVWNLVTLEMWRERWMGVS